MILIPSLDLMRGAVVRLENGQRDRVTELAKDPLAAVRRMQKSGATFFHFTDLDAVFGAGDNRAVLGHLSSEQVGMQVGGGVRDAAAVEALLQQGADRVVIGTLFFDQPDVARKLVERFGVRIMAALDLEAGEVRVRGWEKKSGHAVDAAIDLLQQSGVQHVVCRDIGRDRSSAPDLGVCKRLVALERMAVYLHADVEQLQQLGGLGALEDAGLLGVIVGHAAASDLTPLLAHA